MAIGSDSQASSGAYVWIPEGTGNVLDNPLLAVGSVAYTFSVPVAGNYVVWGRLIDNLGNSFFVSMDSGSYALGDTVGGSTWGWDRVNNRGVADPVVYSLGVGQHTLVIKHREDGAKLDRILVTNDMAYVPQGQGEVSAVPSISVSPASLSASAAQGGNASSQSFQVRNSGGGTLSYTISDSAAWLSVTPTSGTSTGEQDTITVNYATSGLSAGTYSATITVTASGATNSPQTIPVSLNVGVGSGLARVWLEGESGSLTAPMAIGSDSQASSGAYVWIPEGTGNVLYDPLLAVGSVAYTFSVPVAGNYVVWGRLIDNLGNSFFVSMDSGPYALWDTVGGSTWGWDRVNNRGVADPVVYSLGVGQHTLVIKHREDGAKLDRILVTNDMAYVPQGQGEVSAVPSISLTPASLSASAAQGSNASSQSFQVRNSGGGTLSYTISDSATWLSLTPTSGTSTGEQDTITVNYATSGLSAGTYSATITVTASGATNSPQTIPVSLTISALPSISVSPASLSASAAQGGNASSQSFQVGNF